MGYTNGSELPCGLQLQASFTMKQADSQVEQIDKYDAQDRDQAREFAANWVDGTDAEKKLVRKLDWRILVSQLEFRRLF